ncbi:MAG: hypothetical protein ABI238_00310 [Terrimesophilobacter sp.]
MALLLVKLHQQHIERWQHGRETIMADFDPFANQGGQAAWDPEHADDSKKLAADLMKKLAAEEDDPGSGPSTFSTDDES